MSLNKRAFFLLIPVIVFIVYANALGNGFVWDDNNLILENPVLRDIRNMTSVFTKDLHYFTYEKSGFYRPLQTISFIFDHAIWKQNPFGYHLTNILIHAANALLVCLLVNLIFNNPAISFLTGLLFAVHPIQTQAVTYISGRADLLAAFFILLGMVCYVKQRHCEDPERSEGDEAISLRGGFAISKRDCFAPAVLLRKAKQRGLAMTTTCFVFALLSKEIALVFPLLLIGTGLSLRRSVATEAISKSEIASLPAVARNDVVKIVPILSIAAIYIVLRFTALNFFEIHKDALMVGTSWIERLFTFLKIIPAYLRLLVFPSGLHMGWDIVLAKTFFDYRVISGALLVIGLAAFAIKSKDNLYKFAAGWFAICLLPSSNLIVPLNAVMAEHWLYLASIGAFLIAAKGVVILRSPAFCGTTQDLMGNNPEILPPTDSFCWIERIKTVGVRMTRWTIYLVTSFIILFYSTLTFHRNFAWKDDISIYSDTVKHSPNLALVHYNFSNALRKAGRMDEALAAAKRALELQPNFGRALNNLGSIYITKKMYKEAEELYKKAIAVIPNEKEPYSNLGYLYNLLGRYDEAIAELNKALSIAPEFAAGLNNLGNSYLGKGDKGRAVELYKKALKIDPDYKSAKENLRRFGAVVILSPAESRAKDLMGR